MYYIGRFIRTSYGERPYAIGYDSLHKELQTFAVVSLTCNAYVPNGLATGWTAAVDRAHFVNAAEQ